MKNARLDNPYRRAIEESFINDPEPLLVNPPLPIYVSSPNDKYHLVAEYETLDTIAFTYYKNSKYFWVIAHANNFLNPFELYDYPQSSSAIMADIIYSIRTRGYEGAQGPWPCMQKLLEDSVGLDTESIPNITAGITLVIPDLSEYQIRY